MVPQTWILGLLGIIPMIMGINCNTGTIINVTIITITTCGADNIGIYVPLFA